MLRRRTKRPRPEERRPEVRRSAPPPDPQATTSRRRPRPGATVPPQVLAPAKRAATPVEGEVILVTGFEPFGGERTNPSWEICSQLPKTIGRARIETLQVPCRFRDAIETVAKAIERFQPSHVICIGQAGGRDRLSIERVAINVDDARAPDNGGAQPVDEAIAIGGPAAYFSTLPIKAMARAARGAGVPAEVSNTAGTYVCNHLMYGVLHYIAASRLATRAGFIHVPYSEAQVVDKPGQPSMGVAAMARGVQATLAAALEHATDLKVSEGRET